jgi:hypothetical protein
MNSFPNNPGRQRLQLRFLLGAAAGLLLVGALLALGTGWIEPAGVAPDATPMGCWDPALPLLLLAPACQLIFQP